jgi:hypothetical protein
LLLKESGARVNVIENELIVVCDVDMTLIRPSDGGSLNIAYAGVVKPHEPIMEHVELIKSYKHRNFFVIVWSANGYAHAKQAVEALKLERFVDLILSKPLKWVDDKQDIESVLGARVYLV